MEKRYTLSQLTGILVSFEEELGRLYGELIESVSEGSLRDVLGTLMESHKERAEMLRKTSKETVVEMALEPITGLDLERRIEEIKSRLRKETPLTSVQSLEEELETLYREVSSKVSRVSGDVAMLLRQFAKDSERKRSRLTP